MQGDGRGTGQAFKLLDTGLVIPLALATGGALLLRRRTAFKVAGSISGYFMCQGAAVAGMAAVMAVRNDPSASTPFLVLSTLGTLALGGLTMRWVRLYGRASGQALRARLVPRTT